MSNALPVVTATTFDEKVLSSPLPVLVDFWAKWCGPCKRMEPILEALHETFRDRLTIAAINIDRDQSIAMRYAVMSIPTFCLFCNGNIVWRHSGTLSFEGFKKILDKELGDVS